MLRCGPKSAADQSIQYHFQGIYLVTIYTSMLYSVSTWSNRLSSSCLFDPRLLQLTQSMI
jgi:hypothetical protein